MRMRTINNTVNMTCQALSRRSSSSASTLQAAGSKVLRGPERQVRQVMFVGDIEAEGKRTHDLWSPSQNLQARVIVVTVLRQVLVIATAQRHVDPEHGKMKQHQVTGHSLQRKEVSRILDTLTKVSQSWDTGWLKKTLLKEICDFLTLKMLPLALALIKTKNRHLFYPLVRKCSFYMRI